MIGLVVGLLIFSLSVFLFGASKEQAFRRATSAATVWYCLVTLVTACILFLIFLGFVGIGAFTGGAFGAEFANTGLGALIGSLVGAVGSVALLCLIAVYCILEALLLIGGTRIIANCGLGRSFAKFDQVQLAVGSIMVLLGIVLSGGFS